MAYNFFPTGYQYPQTNYPQSNYQNAQNSGVIWVQGEGAAKSYPVAPNTSLALWDAEANVIYIKSADMSGMPSIKILDYTIRDNAPKSAEIQPVADFATKDDVIALHKEIDALKAKFDGQKDARPTKRDKEV